MMNLLENLMDLPVAALTFLLFAPLCVLFALGTAVLGIAAAVAALLSHTGK